MLDPVFLPIIEENTKDGIYISPFTATFQPALMPKRPLHILPRWTPGYVISAASRKLCQSNPHDIWINSFSEMDNIIFFLGGLKHLNVVEKLLDCRLSKRLCHHLTLHLFKVVVEFYTETNSWNFFSIARETLILQVVQNLPIPDQVIMVLNWPEEKCCWS